MSVRSGDRAILVIVFTSHSDSYLMLSHIPQQVGARRIGTPNENNGNNGNNGRPIQPNTYPTLDFSGPHEKLIVPDQITSRGTGNQGNGNGPNLVKLTLRYDRVNYMHPAFNAPVRAYNGNLPGPTIRARPGDRINLKLMNDLTEPLGRYENNEFMVPNTTNIREWHGINGSAHFVISIMISECFHSSLLQIKHRSPWTAHFGHGPG